MVCYLNELREADEERKEFKGGQVFILKSNQPARGKIRIQITSLYAES